VNDAQVIVGGGGIASVIALSGSSIEIDAGGTVVNATLDNGSTEVLNSGAVASATVIDAGASATLVGGVEIGAVVRAGGFEYVSGGVTSEAQIDSGGLVVVGDQGSASGSDISGGGTEIVAGSADGVVVQSGGTFIVLPGAVAVDTVVQSGGRVISSGEVILSGTTVITATTGVLWDATVRAGELGIVYAGGSAVGTKILGGGVLDVYGSTVGTLLSGVTQTVDGQEGSVELVQSGGIASGTRIATSGALFVNSAGTTSGTRVGSGAVEVTSSGGISVNPIVASGGYEVLSSGWTLDLTNLPYDYLGASAALDTTTGVLTVSDGLLHATIGTTDQTDINIELSSDGHGGTLVTEVPCFCRGTLILTARGEIAVESLRAGDGVITASGGARPVRWVGKRAYDGRFVAGNRHMLPVLFKAGSLADGVPKRDLYVSPLHAMYLDGRLIPAWVLVNGASIVQMAAAETVEYFHVELATHDVILAEGAAAESFVDDGGREMFQNAAEFRALYPDTELRPAVYCAPRLDYGNEVEAVCARLEARATACRFADAATDTAEPSLRVISFLISPGATTVDLDGKAGRASVTGIVLDGERLDLMDLRWVGGGTELAIRPDQLERWCHIEMAAVEHLAKAS